MKFSIFLCCLLVHLFILVNSCMSRSRNSQSSRKETTNLEEDGDVQCYDENGKPVPWFIAYKLPRSKTASVPSFKEGQGYGYILPGYKSWRPSSKGIGRTDSIVGRTIKPLFQRDSNLAYLVYNDQPPYRDDIGYNGHSKGIILAKGSKGLWLMHSVPKFPLNDFNEFYPSNGLVNAQIFFCMTLTIPQIDSIGKVFKLTRPIVSNFSIPDSMSNSLKTIKSFTAIKRFSNKGKQNDIFQLKVGNLDFQIFPKGPKFDKEIYLEWLAPNLQSNLQVQSWLSGRNPLLSNCSAHNFQVYNIEDKKIDEVDVGRNDHSKWAVGDNSNNPWICISDLNRMEGQKSRGGGTLCTSNSDLWTAFYSSITDLQPCPRSIG